MPLYEYICESCRRKCEILVRSARPRVVCPSCGSAKLSRQFSTFSAHGAPSTPCAGGTCPGSSDPAGACAGGTCPFA